MKSSHQNKIFHLYMHFQRALSHILPDDAVLVGHTLECDLNALRITHPYCVDISLCLNLSGKERQRSSLKVILMLFCEESHYGPVLSA